MLLNHEVVYTTTGTKPSLDFDTSISPFGVSIACSVVTGPVSYKLQYTIDDFSDPLKTDATATWFDSTDIPAGTNGDAFSSLTSPVSRVRLVIATLSAGSIKLQTQQGMSIN